MGTFAALEEALADVLPLVRFPIMTLNEFTTVVLPAGLLKQDDLMQMYTYFGSNKDTRLRGKFLLNLILFLFVGGKERVEC